MQFHKPVLWCLAVFPLPPSVSLASQAPCDKAPGLTGHGFKAHHAAHEVSKAHSPVHIAVAQGHQVQDLLIDGQACGGEQKDSTGDHCRVTDWPCWPRALTDKPSSLSDWVPSGPPHSSMPSPSCGRKSWGRVAENPSPSHHMNCGYCRIKDSSLTLHFSLLFSLINDDFLFYGA